MLVLLLAKVTGLLRSRRTVRPARRALVWALASASALFVVTGPGRAAHASPESPNLLVGDHGSFDLTTGGWVGNNATLAHVTSPTQAGTGALAMTATTAGTMGASSGNGPPTWTPAQPGQVYTGSAWVQAGGSTGRSVQALLGFISSTGQVTNAVWGQLTPDTAGSWIRTTPVVGIAPPGTAYVELAVDVIGAAPGETHYVDTASLTTHTVANNAVAGPLHTSGNTIYDANNAPLRLRGATMEWLDVNPSIAPGSPLDDNSVAHMKQWGINIVRVPLSEDFWTPNDCDFAPDYVTTVDQVVQSITSRGMVALLDLHHNTRQPGTCPSSQQDMADSPGSVNFWASVAGRYQNNPLVAFDLYNEPHNLTWSQWLNGGTLTDTDPNGVRVTWQAAGMQQLYNAVRGTGARNLVFVSGNGYATVPPPGTALVSGYNIVYAAHYYTCPTSQPPPADCQKPDPSNPAPSPGQRLDAWSPLAAAQPMLVTEFGWPDPGNGTYTQNVINWAEAKGVGWTPFEWAQGNGPSTGDFGFLADQSVFEPAASGMPVLAGLAGQVPSPSPVPPSIVGVEGTDAGLWVRHLGDSGFTGLGGVLAGAPAIASVPQASGPSLPLYVVTGSDHRLWVRSDTQGFQLLTNDPTYCIDNPAAVVTGISGAATLTVACQGGDHALYTINGPVNAGTLPTLNGWTDLGGILAAGPAVAPVGPAGNLTFLVDGTDGHVWSRTATTPFVQMPWMCLGHPALASSGTTTTFACDGTDHALWFATNRGTGWSSTQSLGGILVDGPGLAAGASGTSFFVQGSDSALWQNFVPNGGGPAGWYGDGGAVLQGAGAVGLG